MLEMERKKSNIYCKVTKGKRIIIYKVSFHFCAINSIFCEEEKIPLYTEHETYPCILRGEN